MEIRNFDSVRIGSGFPNAFTISKIEYHESYGIYASAYVLENTDQILELRRNKHGEIAFFNYRSKDMKLPDAWVNSEILWKNY